MVGVNSKRKCRRRNQHRRKDDKIRIIEVIKEYFMSVIVFACCTGMLGHGIMGVACAQDTSGKYDISSITNHEKLEAGRLELEKLGQLAINSRLPKIGQCWKAALHDLQSNCEEMDEESHARLALNFASCFLDMVGSSNIVCELGTPIKSCLTTLDSNGLSTFREYFMHTNNMCHYLRSRIWHEQSNEAVNLLTQTTRAVGRTVIEQKAVADSILQSQQSSYKVQNELLMENMFLLDKVVAIKSNVEAFGEEAREQRVIFGEIFEKLKRMQDLIIWIKGEMSFYDIITYYVVGLLLSFFITSADRTREARLWMNTCLVISFIVERYLYCHLVGMEDLNVDDVLFYISLYRKCIAIVQASIFLYYWYKYRDYDTINNDLLNAMKARMDDMVQNLKELTNRNTTYANGCQHCIPELMENSRYHRYLDYRRTFDDNQDTGIQSDESTDIDQAGTDDTAEYEPNTSASNEISLHARESKVSMSSPATKTGNAENIPVRHTFSKISKPNTGTSENNLNSDSDSMAEEEGKDPIYVSPSKNILKLENVSSPSRYYLRERRNLSGGNVSKNLQTKMNSSKTTYYSSDDDV